MKTDYHKRMMTAVVKYLEKTEREAGHFVPGNSAIYTIYNRLKVLSQKV